MNESFVFYKDWADTIDMLDEEAGKDLLYKIYLIGVNREEEIFVDNPFEKSFLNRVQSDIDRAKVKYIHSVVNGKKGGRPKIDLDIDEIMSLVNSGFTYDQIAKYMGVSRNTIGDRVREYRNQKLNTIPETKTNTYLKDKVKEYVDVEENEEVEVDVNDEAEEKVNHLIGEQ